MSLGFEREQPCREGEGTGCGDLAEGALSPSRWILGGLTMAYPARKSTTELSPESGKRKQRLSQI